VVSREGEERGDALVQQEEQSEGKEGERRKLRDSGGLNGREESTLPLAPPPPLGLFFGLSCPP
jgi:hypothetical protein